MTEPHCGCRPGTVLQAHSAHCSLPVSITTQHIISNIHTAHYSLRSDIPWQLLVTIANAILEDSALLCISIGNLIQTDHQQYSLVVLQCTNLDRLSYSETLQYLEIFCYNLQTVQDTSYCISFSLILAHAKFKTSYKYSHELKQMANNTHFHITTLTYFL